MLRKMKKIHIIIIILSLSLTTNAQTTTDVINKVKELRQEKGDSIARDYLIAKHDVFVKEEANPTYLILWGVLTSSMWDSNPTASLKKEYKEYLDFIFDDEISSESFIPDENALNTLWNLMTDYYNILFNDGDNQTSLKVLTCLHRWFNPYPEARNTIGYAQSLFDYCSLLRILQRYDELTPLFEEYIEVCRKVYGEASTQYARALYLSSSTPNMPVSEKVERIKNAISIYEVAEDKDPTTLEDMRKAYDVQLTSMTGVTNKKNFQVSSNGMYDVGDCLALLTVDRGAEAIESLLYHKDLLSKQQPFNIIEYSKVISYLLAIYIGVSDLVAAQKEIEDFDKMVGISNLPPSYSQIFYSSAGLVAMQLKDFPNALKNLHIACKLSEQNVLSDLEYCKILGNIGVTYMELVNSNRYKYKQFLLDAKWYIDEAISLFEEKIGPLTEHGSVGITSLNNKALIYDAIGDREGAIETYEKIVSDYADKDEIKETWALAVNNLSTLYMKTNQTEKAVRLLESISSNNRELSKLFKQNLASVYYLTGNEKLKSTLMEYNQICYNNCMDVFNYFTVAEREAFWTMNARELLSLNNLIADKYPYIADVAYNNLLFVKNLKLMSSDVLKSIVEESSNPDLINRYNRISYLRDAISYRSNEQDSLELWQDQMKKEERSLLSLVPDYKEKLMGSFHSWSEVKDALKKDEIVIDFTYVAKMENWEKVEGYYGAYVITSTSSKPELVSLCKVDDVNHYYTGKTMDAMQISALYKDSLSIYENIWKKLEGYFKDKKTIYFSPTGGLNLLNHEAIVMPDGQIFGDKYNLIRLSSTDKILARASTKEKQQSAVVYGGIQYDLSVADMNEAAKKYKHSNGDDSFLMAMRSEDERGRWNYLPGTKTESENIYKLLTSSKINATLLQESAANEESFKSLNGHSPNIIHLSTHGFFLDTNQKVMANPFMSNVGNYSEKEDQLIRTGLLMAGSNNVWCGREKVSGIEDGILTADEISRLDLSGTNLVVLSACETAKGQVDEIDGVLGLQRGFKKAGAKSIMMSLWKVSDAVTSMLMTEFYSNLGKDMSTKEALKAATEKIRNQYPDPYFWAAFILLDGMATEN